MNMDPRPAGPPPPGRAEPGAAGRGRRRLRAALRAAAGVAVVVLAALVLADRWAPGVVERVAVRYLPLEGVVVEVASTDVRRNGVTLTGVRVEAGPGDTLVADTLLAELSLGGLLRRPIRLRRLRAVGLRVAATRDTAGWGWLRWSGQSPDPAADSGGPVLVIDRIELSGVAVEAVDAAGGELLAIEGLGADVVGLRVRPGVSFSVPSLSFRVRAPGLPAEGVRAEASFRTADDEWVVDRAEVGGREVGRLAVGGRIGPAAASGRALDVRGTAEGLAVARLHPALGARLRGDLRLDLEGVVGGTLERPAVDARMEVAGGGSVEVESSWRAGEGGVVGEGRIRALGLDPSVLVEDGPDVEPITGDIAGTLRGGAGGELAGPVTFDLTTRLDGRPVRLAGRVDVDGAKLRLNVAAGLSEGQIRIEGQVDRSAPEPLYDLRAISTAALPDAVLALFSDSTSADPWLASVHIRGADLARADLDARLTPGSAVAAGAGARVTGVLTRHSSGGIGAKLHLHAVERGSLAGTMADVDLGVDGGRVVATARATRGELVLEVRRAELEAGHLSLEARLLAAGQEVRLSGDGALGRGAVQGRLTAAVDSARLGGVAVGPTKAIVRLDDGRLALEGEAEVGRLTASLTGSAERPGEGSWAGTAALRVLDRVGPSDLDTLDLGLGITPPDPAAPGLWQIDVGGGGRIAGLSLDSIVVLGAAGTGTVRLDRLAITGPALEIRGDGTIPLDLAGPARADAAFTARTRDLAALIGGGEAGGAYHGRVEVDLRSAGPAGAMRHTAGIALGGLRGPHVEIDSLEATIVAESGPERWLERVTVNATAEGGRPIRFPLGPLPLRAGLGSSDPTGSAARTGTGRTRVDLGLEWDPDVPGSVEVVRVDALLNGEAWTLDGPARVGWGDSLTVQGLAMSSIAGRVRADGWVDPRGEQDLEIAISGIPIQVVREDGGMVLSRTVDLDLELTGPGQAPRLSVTGELGGGEGSAAPVSIEADWTVAGLTVMAGATQAGGGRLTLDGLLPLPFSLAGEEPPPTDGEVRVGIEAELLDLAPLRELFGPGVVSRLAGTVDGRLEAAGSLEHPRVSGRLGVEELRLDLPTWGTALRAREVALVGAGDGVRIDTTTIRDPADGSVRLAGGVVFPDPGSASLDIQARFDRFRAADSRLAHAVITGDLDVDGPVTSPMVRGRLRVDQGTIRLGEGEGGTNLERVELTEADYREIEERFGIPVGAPSSAAGPAGIGVDLVVVAESNVWLRRPFEPAMAVELAGELHITQPPEGELSIDGRVDVVEGRSHVEEFGRRFDISSGGVRFDGPPSSVELQATAVYDPTDDVTIELEIRGDPSGFSLTLGSDPSMDETDIVSYLVLGRASGEVPETGSGTSSEVAGLGAELALSRVAGGVEELARQSLGLDVVEIRQDGLKGLTLEAGRYLNRRLYIGFEQPAVQAGTEGATFGIDDTEVKAEYRVTDWLLANLSGSRSLARFFLGVRHAY